MMICVNFSFFIFIFITESKDYVSTICNESEASNRGQVAIYSNKILYERGMTVYKLLLPQHVL